MEASIIAAIAAIVSALISAIAAVIAARSEADAKARDAEQARREQWRTEEAIKQGQMISALCDLSDVTATAVKGGHINGNLEEAQAKARAAKSDYNSLLREIALKDININSDKE